MTAAPTSGPYDVVVLAGGGARRLDGVDKPGVVVRGRTLLARVLDAVPDARRRVVVGARRAYDGVCWVREDPPGGGPVAALAAALPMLDAPVTVVLAADLPFLTVGAVGELRAHLGDADAVLAVDRDWRDQPLLAVWRTAALRAAVAAVPEPVGARLRALVPERAHRRALPGWPPPWWDCDTADDLALARRWAAMEDA